MRWCISIFSAKKKLAYHLTRKRCFYFSWFLIIFLLLICHFLTAHYKICFVQSKYWVNKTGIVGIQYIFIKFNLIASIFLYQVEENLNCDYICCTISTKDKFYFIHFSVSYDHKHFAVTIQKRSLLNNSKSVTQQKKIGK